MKITQSDLELFSAASHDVNPMHMNSEYARKTAFGEPVVFGVLGALAALGHLPNREQSMLAAVNFTFHSPLLRDIDYQPVVTTRSPEKSMVDVFDAGKLMLTAIFTFRTIGETDASFQSSIAASVPPSARTEPAVWPDDALAGGAAVSGVYLPDQIHLKRLIERWILQNKGASAGQIGVLVWSSYLIGMELPGKAALYSSLRLTFEPLTPEPDTPLNYHCSATGLDPRFQMLKIAMKVEAAGLPVATGQASSLIRPESPVTSAALLREALPRDRKLSGKSAVVIGGSRGFGSALALALALQGAHVYLTYRNSAVEAETVRKQAEGFEGKIEIVQGDASKIDGLRDLRERLAAEHGGLDILICNACPPIRALAFAPESLDRLQDFVGQSIALVSAPMAAFIGLLAKSGGWNVVVSSEFVRAVPAEWPHYVAAKCAIEGLTRAVAVQQPRVKSLIVRPPRLLTDQTNTPMGRMVAMPVETAAAAVVQRLTEDAPQGVEIMETFGEEAGGA